jgi:hypothetical protein
LSLITHREREVKLELLSSLAKSQAALARILDSIAVVSEASPELARNIAENVKLLTEMQKNITEAVTGLSLKRKRRKMGSPVHPWLNTKITRIRMSSRRRRLI